LEADEQIGEEAQENADQRDIDNVIVHTGAACSDGGTAAWAYDVMDRAGRALQKCQRALLAQA